MICSLKSTQKQRFFPSFVTYSECLIVAILTFSSVYAVLFLRMKERVYSTISLGIKRGKGNKIENHKKILSKWRNLVSNSSGNWRRGKPWSLILGRQPHLSLEFLETIRVVKRDTNVRKKLSLFHCQDSIELGKNAYLPEVSFRTWATIFLNKGVWFERFQKPYLFT